MGSIWADPDELRKEFISPPDVSPMGYLLARMRHPETEEHVKTRIAIALLPFTEPKLAVTASVPFDERFGINPNDSCTANWVSWPGNSCGTATINHVLVGQHITYVRAHVRALGLFSLVKVGRL
jgi:hypothetical protein